MIYERKPGPTAGREEGAEWFARRRFILKWSSAALVGALAFGGKIPGLTLTDALAQSPGGAHARMGDAVDLGEGDVGVLNYAYALEQLEAAFYAQALKTPYGGMQSEARDMLTTIRNHEIAHREFFKAALKKNAIPDLEVDFTKVDFNSKDSVLSTAKTFEDLGVAAYNGAGQLLENGAYLLLAGKIVSVEARHAAAIRSLIGPDGKMAGSGNNTGSGSGNNTGGGGSGSRGSGAGVNWMEVVGDKGLDKAMLPSEVLPIAAPFIKTKITAENLA